MSADTDKALIATLAKIREMTGCFTHGTEQDLLIEINRVADLALDPYDFCPLHGDISETPGDCPKCKADDTQVPEYA